MRKDPLFDEQLATLAESRLVPRLEEIVLVVGWALEIGAEWYPLVDERGTRLAKSEGFPNAPELRFYFTIDSDTECTLRWVELGLPPDPEVEDFSG